ncbi:neuronal-specific septin-3 isoform X1 [Syngnathus typhle]|uniref:neuronal-specific septin-3 isoform X1 n=3 Tax=Syngnathus typhle TaxID=161592 RepID=UPI002A69ADA5|nr:neuronal-specific septin-3 isoform X1 [Syngnathus typhle]XP_061129335.1 neuronal-specific septin-3 isoform X1 [Syngnathus typhle]
MSFLVMVLVCFTHSSVIGTRQQPTYAGCCLITFPQGKKQQERRMSVFDRLSPLIPRLSASSKQAKEHPHLPHPPHSPHSSSALLFAPVKRKGIDIPPFKPKGVSFGSASSSSCLGLPTTLLDQTEPQARLNQKASLDFPSRDHRVYQPGYEKMHCENQTDAWMTPEASRTCWREDPFDPQLRWHSKEDTKSPSSNTSVNVESIDKQRFWSTPWTDVDLEHSCQSREKPPTTQAPWWTYRGTSFKTCLVHPVQTSSGRHKGISSANGSEERDFQKGAHEACTKLQQDAFNLDRPSPECSKEICLPGEEPEDPYYVSIFYPDSVYEAMSDIVPPEVRPKPAVPAKPPNVGAPSPSNPFPPQGPGIGGVGGVSAAPPSAIPVPIGNHGPSHGGAHAGVASHAVGHNVSHGAGHAAAHVGSHGHGTSNSTSGGSTLLGYIGIDTIIEQMRKKTMKTGFDFNIMVVGHSGLGKSTLLNTLFKSQVSRRSAGWSRDDKIPKTVEIKSVSHVIEEGGVKMKLTVVDTPGFGDLINNDNCWEPICKYINEQYEKFLKEEVNITRKKRIPDTRVHCCLYFISPTGHSLRQLDVEFMKRLSHSVNIIPVIAKADTMTPEERQEFKQRVKKELEMNGIEFYPQKEFDEDMEDKSDNDKIREAMPFAVVGSDKEYQVNGKRVLGRKTAWGVVEVENMNHCEFAQLRDFIIRSHLQDLKEVTHNIHYETYRAKRLHENGGLHPVDSQESNL